MPVRSDVALDLIETVNGNIEFIAVQILQQQKIIFNPINRQLLKPR